MPKRDDIGERRRKHELRVLSGAGVEPDDEAETFDSLQRADPGPVSENSESEESEEDFYEQVKQQRAAKLAAKAEEYSRFIFYPDQPILLEEVIKFNKQNHSLSGDSTSNIQYFV